MVILDLLKRYGGIMFVMMLLKLYFNGGTMIPCNRQRYFDADQGLPQNHRLIVVWCVVCFC
jgi:hypothetical protein